MIQAPAVHQQQTTHPEIYTVHLYTLDLPSASPLHLPCLTSSVFLSQPLNKTKMCGTDGDWAEHLAGPVVQPSNRPSVGRENPDCRDRWKGVGVVDGC